jgi:S1-C subfamily serine protease
MCPGDAKRTARQYAAHHLGGRGAMVPNPVIEVACSTPGGLSGGPAFDKHGKVFGILSVSIDDPDG